MILAAQKAAPGPDFPSANFVDGLEGSSERVLLGRHHLLLGKRAHHDLDGSETEEMKIDRFFGREEVPDLRRIEWNPRPGRVGVVLVFASFAFAHGSTRLRRRHVVDRAPVAQPGGSRNAPRERPVLLVRQPQILFGGRSDGRQTFVNRHLCFFKIVDVAVVIVK